MKDQQSPLLRSNRQYGLIQTSETSIMSVLKSIVSSRRLRPAMMVGADRHLFETEPSRPNLWYFFKLLIQEWVSCTRLETQVVKLGKVSPQVGVDFGAVSEIIGDRAVNLLNLRIENRALPSGPTTTDEIANAAFFIGLMLSLPREYGDISKRMSFDEAKTNFFSAARHGLNAQFNWIDGKNYSASALILDHLLSLARQGLESAGVDTSDIGKYLGVINERVQSGQTGAQWMLKSLAAAKGPGPKDACYRALTSTMLQQQKEGKPVQTWPVIQATEDADWRQSYQTVGQFMATDLFTVRLDDLVDLAASVMDWRHIRHVPVEDEQGRLVGLVTHRALLRLLSRGRQTQDTNPLTVREIMVSNPVTVSSTTPTLEALELMRSNKVGCLPVVDDDQLVGIVTSYDFLDASARLFKEQLTASTAPHNQSLKVRHA